MREILVYDDYEIHKLGAGGGSQYEEVTTEKATRIDVNDVAKTKGKLLPFGRTTQKQLSGSNKLDEETIRNATYSESVYKYTLTNIQGGTLYFKASLKEGKTPINGLFVAISSNGGNPNYGTSIFSIKKGVITNETTDFTNVSDIYFSVYPKTVSIEELFETYNFWVSNIDTPYEPYCGGQPSPNPDYPQPIENVEGRSCSNLFNPEYFLQHKNDFINAYSGYFYAIELGDEYKKQITASISLKGQSQGLTGVVLAFTSSYGTSPGGATRILTIDGTTKNITYDFSNAEHVYLQVGAQQQGVAVNKLDEIFANYNIQINEGSTALPYEEYFEGKRLELNVCNKNLAKALRLGYYVGATGVYVADTTHTCSSEPIKIRNGATYKYSVDGVGVEGYAYEYDENDNYLGRKYFSASSAYTPTNGATYFNYAFKDSTLANVPLNSKVQIEEGTATPYEEHKEQMIPFPLAEGQKLMEGDYLADDGIHHVRGKTILPNATGLNAITLGGVAGQYFAYSLPNGKPQGNAASNNFISNKLSYNYNRIKNILHTQ